MGQYPAPRTRTRRSRDSFTAKDRRVLYLLNAASHDDYLARCVLCGRVVTLHGPQSGPGSETVAVAGHVLARADGGRPAIGNGRIECTACSRADGRLRFLAAVAAGRRRRRGLPEPAAEPTSSLGRWLVQEWAPRH